MNANLRFLEGNRQKCPLRRRPCKSQRSIDGPVVQTSISWVFKFNCSNNDLVLLADSRQVNHDGHAGFLEDVRRANSTPLEDEGCSKGTRRNYDELSCLHGADRTDRRRLFRVQCDLGQGIGAVFHSDRTLLVIEEDPDRLLLDQ